MTRRFKKIPVWFTLSLMMALGTTPAVNAGNERNALYYYRQAEHFRERGDFRAAVSNYRTSIEKNAGFPAAHLGAAQSYYELGDWSRSRAHFERVLELDRENVPARIGLGLVYVQLGQFEQARTMLMQVRSRDPGNADNNHALGVYNYRVGNQVLAEAYFQKAIRIRPAHVPALIGLARLYADQRRYPQAREYLDQARRVQPMHAAIHVTTGEVELSQAFHATSRLRRNDHLNEAGEAFLTAH
ncbi:MAG: tetratricopeptide repeat protein, partial [Leptospiraceae bacterium]|nr:tetratricopeptide repeat protein [Leptospiraceae bacterium]